MTNDSAPPGNLEPVPVSASEEQFRRILEASPDGFILLQNLRDATGTIVDFVIAYTNPVAARGVNLTQAELLGQRLLQLFPDCQTNGIFDRYVAVAESGISTTFETFYQSPQLTGWFRHVVVQLPDQIAVSLSDITDRKQTELALQQQEQHFRVALQAAKLGSWEHDLTTGVLTCSAQCKANFGLPPEAEFTHETLFAALHPDDRPMVQATIQQAISTRTDYEVEERCYHPDGSLHWLTVRGQLVYNSQGEPIRLVGVTLDITDRKHAEDTLRQREAELRLITNTVPVLISLVDHEQRYRFVNQGYERLFQRSAAELQGEYLWNVLGQAAYEIIRPYVEQVLAGQEVTFESKIPFEAVGVRDVSVTYVPRWNSQGQVEGFVALVTDIAQHKQTEEHLRQSAERLRIAQQAANAGVWDWDITTNQVTWSEEYYHLYGLDPATTAPSYENWLKSIIPADRDRVDQISHQALVHQTDLNVEFRICHPTHGERWLTAIGQTFYDQHQQPQRMTGIALDITDRKQIEEALRNSAEQLSFALTAAKLGDWSWHATTDMVTLSEQAAAMFSIPPGPYMTWSQMQTLIHPDDRDRARYQVEHAIAHRSNYDIEYRVVRPNGTSRWIAAKGRAQYDASGAVLGMLGVVQDITPRKQAEAEREQLLARERAARQEAEQANRIKDEFLAVLSHELRSPLNPILGWSKLLRTRQFDAVATARALETIERNAKLQAQLIEDLLDVSRILRGKMVLNVASVHLETVIDAALETVRLAAEAKGIAIHKRVANAVGLISGDASRLQQIMWNLLSNAVKFTSEAGQIEIRLDQVGNYAQIQVKDTGKGIAPEFLPQVFDYFRQEDGTTTRKFGGLGLGLAIVRYLTEQHGGTVNADSPGVGCGATFTVLLPLLRPSAVGHVEHRESEHLPSALLPLAHRRILIVDDETDMRELISTILQATGAEIRVAASAVAALTILPEFQPDLLISDIGMPEIDGYTFLQQVRQLPPEQGGQIPAIALTAYAGELDRQQAIAAGFQRHLSKPIEPEELITAITGLVQENP
ncbi:PAS domain-containing protein [Pantanalinema rosaneae CENA516]|uniref:hybrid sensor histidine kinase/response regulator n=1 Tax=Pantanalinema rosaneae TaxID=1620701 RepID=UPI003D6DEB64